MPDGAKVLPADITPNTRPSDDQRGLSANPVPQPASRAHMRLTTLPLGMTSNTPRPEEGWTAISPL
ncbi:MAG: hypothetical protein ABI355_19615 [Solirubrobacteraceae bacterium]